MAKTIRTAGAGHNISLERAARLVQLVKLLGKVKQPRLRILQRLKINVRGFYRDLEELRLAGVTVLLLKGHYVLADQPDVAIARLPFPDPCLTLGEARQLARGRSRAHKKLQANLARIVP